MTLYTGGAKGADYEFAAQAIKFGHKAIVMSFEKHKEQLQKLSNVEVKRLKPQELKTADTFLGEAVKKIERVISSNTYVKNLLRRNYFQIKDTTSVYAVGEFIETGKKDSVNISGGTAWACQMFVDKTLKQGMSQDNHKIGLYFFSQKENSWFQCSLSKSNINWEKIQQPPQPKGNYTGIGTRELLTPGREAIKSLYQN